MIKEKLEQGIEFVKDHKKEIVIGGLVIVVGGLSFVVFKQKKGLKLMNDNMSALKTEVNILQHDVNVLNHVMDETVLASLKTSLTKRLRYAEGRLSNGLASGVISEADIKLRKEEIEFYSKELEKIFEAEQILKSRKRG